MVIAVGGCDNVEWGGIEIAIVPPPPQRPAEADPDSANALPDRPVLFYVHRDGGAATIIPVGQVTEAGLARIAAGDDTGALSRRFIDAFLAEGTELALFRGGRRVGSVTVESAAVPEGPVCRPLPRATGRVTLTDDGDTGEFLALATGPAADAPTPAPVAPNSGMEVVSDMMAGEMLRARGAAVPSAAGARRQLAPFPLQGSADPGFTATYLVRDTLGVGADDAGAALFVVFTPQGQTGYDTAFVGFADYATGGKAAPRVIDYLDWDGDGNVELLLEVFGTRASWFRAVGLEDGRWRAIFQDRCDPLTAPIAADTGPSAAAQPAGGQQTPPPGPTAQRSAPTTTQPAPSLDSIADIQPRIQLSNPTSTPRLRRDTTGPDTIPATPPDTVPPDTIPAHAVPAAAAPPDAADGTP